MEAARKGRAGFADPLIAEVAFEFGTTEIITFDKDFRRKQSVRRLKYAAAPARKPHAVLGVMFSRK